MNGIIALDIDGTVCAKGESITPAVSAHLDKLSHDGWVIAFITGRPFALAMQLLHSLSFPYFLAVQNGALILQMPAEKVLHRCYLDCSILEELEAIFEKEPTGVVIYAGYEKADLCYFCPHTFSEPLLNFANRRKEICSETWKSLSSFSELPIKEFASVKGFGKFPSAEYLSSEMERRLGMHAPIIVDPFDQASYVVQATRGDVDKGQALFWLKRALKWKGCVIGCGDDLNDCSLFSQATVKIAMEDAPDLLLKKADFVAPSAEKEGIVVGLNWAVKQ